MTNDKPLSESQVSIMIETILASALLTVEGTVPGAYPPPFAIETTQEMVEALSYQKQTLILATLAYTLTTIVFMVDSPEVIAMIKRLKDQSESEMNP